MAGCAVLETMKTFATRLLLPALAVLALTGRPAPADPVSATDDRATEIALGSLAAMERGWALSAYDRAPRVRASVNLRGRGLGVTANAVLDRPGRRWRLDAAGDIGPLTLLVAEGSALLHVPAFGQHARGAAGGLAPGATVGRSLAAEVATMRARLEAGYDGLAWRGEETLGGHRVHRLVEQGAGETATYWIDAGTSLPRRIALERPGGKALRVDFTYGAGPRPTRVDIRVTGERELTVVASPAYDGQGRAKHLHLSVRPAGAAPLEADVNLDWAPRLADGFFRLAPPADSRSVPFAQLAQGVMFQAAGVLGALARVLGGF